MYAVRPPARPASEGAPSTPHSSHTPTPTISGSDHSMNRYSGNNMKLTL